MTSVSYLACCRDELIEFVAEPHSVHELYDCVTWFCPVVKAQYPRSQTIGWRIFLDQLIEFLISSDMAMMSFLAARVEFGLDEDKHVPSPDFIIEWSNDKAMKGYHPIPYKEIKEALMLVTDILEDEYSLCVDVINFHYPTDDIRFPRVERRSTFPEGDLIASKEIRHA